MKIDMYDYYECSFAMEVVNGEIISLTPDMQEKIVERIRKKLKIKENELIEFLQTGDSDDERFDVLNDTGAEALSVILGYDDNKCDFVREGIGFLESPLGWEAKELMEALEFNIHEKIEYGPHGHGTYGVYWYNLRKKKNAD